MPRGETLDFCQGHASSAWSLCFGLVFSGEILFSRIWTSLRPCGILRRFDAIWALESALDFDPSAALDRLYLYLERVFLLKGILAVWIPRRTGDAKASNGLKKREKRAPMAQKNGRLASNLARARGGASI